MLVLCSGALRGLETFSQLVTFSLPSMPLPGTSIAGVGVQYGIAGAPWSIQDRLVRLCTNMCIATASITTPIHCRSVRPRYGHRGILLDVGRRFFPIQLLENIIDAMVRQFSVSF